MTIQWLISAIMLLYLNSGFVYIVFVLLHEYSGKNGMLIRIISLSIHGVCCLVRVIFDIKFGQSYSNLIIYVIASVLGILLEVYLLHKEKIKGGKSRGEGV